MQFVPAGGKDVLFAVWETRRRDFEIYASADSATISEWRRAGQKTRRRLDRVEVLTTGGWLEGTSTWRDPGFPQSQDDPVTAIAQLDAELFCEWLTIHERNEARLHSPQHYRLPTDSAWSTAAGLPDESGAYPRMKSSALVPPPPDISGNCAGAEASLAPWPPSWPVRAIPDDFPSHLRPPSARRRRYWIPLRAGSRRRRGSPRRSGPGLSGPAALNEFLEEPKSGAASGFFTHGLSSPVNQRLARIAWPVGVLA